MGWLRKFLGIEPNDHPAYSERFPSEHYPQGTVLTEDDDDMSSHHGGTWTVIDPFHELDKLMQDQFMVFGSLFNGASPSNHSFEGPPPRPTNPRDQLLKQPDSEISPNASEDTNSRFLPSSEHLEGNEHHQSIHPFNPEDFQRQSFSLFDHLNSVMELFNSLPSHHGGHFSEQQPAISPRDGMLKQDTDVDDLTGSSGLDSLLSKEVPSYSYSPGGGSLGQPEGGSGWLSPFPGSEPHVQRSFTSTSIRRIVRPDGSIEERRTYRDSSGKEEVTVTEMDPTTAGSLLPKDDVFGHSGSGSLLNSFFRGLF